MAGLTKMPLARFLVADAAGGMIWASSLLGIGFAFHGQLEDVARVLARTGFRLGEFLAGMAGLWIGYKIYQRRRFIRKFQGSRITPEEVQEHMNDFFLVDLRHAEEVAEQGKITGAVWFDRKELERHHREIPRDRDVVLYCS